MDIKLETAELCLDIIKDACEKITNLVTEDETLWVDKEKLSDDMLLLVGEIILEVGGKLNLESLSAERNRKLGEAYEYSTRNLDQINLLKNFL